MLDSPKAPAPDDDLPQGENESPEVTTTAKASRGQFWQVANTISKIAAQFILIAAIGFGAYEAFQRLMASKPEAAQRTARERVWVIETVKAIPQDITPSITVYGETVARRTVELRSFVGGQIISVSPNLNEGLVVERGEALVEIDRFDYEGAVVEARAQLKEAEANLKEIEVQIANEKSALSFTESQLELAKVDLTRIENLRERGSATDKSVDDRRLIVSQRQETLTQKTNNLTVLAARIEQRSAQIDRLEWTLQRAERNLADTVLRAPFSGIVTAQNADVGKLVSVNDAVASLQEIGAIDVKFTVPDSYFGRLAANGDTLLDRPVVITWAVGGQNLSYKGHISRIGSRITAATGGVEMFASVTVNPELPHLRPGAFVEITFDDVTYSDVIELPQTAIYDNTHLFIKQEDRLKRVDIDIRGKNDELVLVSGDLDPNADIMITRLPRAGDGVKVRLQGEKPQGRAGTGNQTRKPANNQAGNAQAARNTQGG